MGRALEAQDGSAREDGSVVTWGRVPKSLMALGRSFCRCVSKSLMGSPEVGSVVTWRRVPKSLMALGRSFCRCVSKSLICSPEVGSVVTWRGVPLSLMDLWSEGSVQGPGATSVLCFFSFVSLALVKGCTMWPQPDALGSVADCHDCYAAVGWSVDVVNFHHMEACRFDLIFSGKSVGVLNVQGMS